MSKITPVLMAALFLAASAGWAQTTHRKHTRPPYSGPMKPVDKGKLKPPLLPHKNNAKRKTESEQAPKGRIIVR